MSSFILDAIDFKPTHMNVRIWQWLLHAFLPLGIYFISWEAALVSFFVYFCFHGIGSAIGAHRYFTHKAFQTTRFMEWVMTICHTLGSGGSTLGYILVHLNHHPKADKTGDPHNPTDVGFVRAWLGLFRKENLRIAPKMFAKLYKRPELRFTHDHYWKIIAAYIIGLLVLGGPWLVLYGYIIPAIGVYHANAALIVLTHYYVPFIGTYRAYDTDDKSYNLNPLLKIVLFGEEMHNNHHKRPSAINLNLRRRWYEFDPLYWVIRIIRTS